MRSPDPLPHKFETPNHAQFLDPYLIFQSTFLKIPPRSKGDNTDYFVYIALSPCTFLKVFKVNKLLYLYQPLPPPWNLDWQMKILYIYIKFI